MSCILGHMAKLITLAKTNPTRIYSIVAALVAVLAIYVTSLPVVPILTLAAAILGLNEGIRAVVTPETRAKARVHDAYVHGVEDGAFKARHNGST